MVATAVGQTTYMPLRVNMAGVIPVIFAAAVLLLPPTIGQIFGIEWLATTFAPTTWASIILEFGLIVVFTFFYTAVQFNPVEQADNLKKYGGFIPGIRPGRPTAQFLDHVMVRLTLPVRSTWASSRCRRRSSSATRASRRPRRGHSAARRC